MKLVYSAGAFAREFHRLTRAQYPGEELLFINDAPGVGDLSYAEACAHPDRGEIIVGFADCALRQRKTAQVLADGFTLFSTVAETAILGENVSIGPGSVISDHSILTTDVQIGEGFQANTYCHIGHDCVVGDFVTLAPRATLTGRIVVEDGVYIGTGATVLQGQPDRFVRIGKGAVIGAHALVKSDVPAGATMVGIPAKPLAR